jgi:hypothetical protein
MKTSRSHLPVCSGTVCSGTAQAVRLRTSYRASFRKSPGGLRRSATNGRNGKFRERCFALALLCLASSLPLARADEPSDAEKLKHILDGKNQFTRAQRMKRFEPEGEIDTVGRLVEINGKVYFKTADQSYIPEGRRFPYPELFLELHLSETYAYRPLIEQGIIQARRVAHDGRIRIKGNWAYERPYHIFGLVWVDEVTKVAAIPNRPQK